MTGDRKLKRRRTWKPLQKEPAQHSQSFKNNGAPLGTRKQPGRNADEETRGQSWKRMRGRDDDDDDDDEGLPDAAVSGFMLPR